MNTTEVLVRQPADSFLNVPRRARERGLSDCQRFLSSHKFQAEGCLGRLVRRSQSFQKIADRQARLYQFGIYLLMLSAQHARAS